MIGMRKSIFAALILSLAAARAALAGPERSDDLAARLDRIFAEAYPATGPGAAVIVVRDGKPILRKGYGLANVELSVPIAPEMVFRVGSVTKQFTAMAVMLLVHDGKLRYDDRLTDIFPDFPDYGKTITIRNLLNHTSGLLDYEDLMESQPPATRDEDIRQIQDAGVLALLKQQKTTKFTPGTKWDYSNSGYVLLGIVVRQVSGKPFGQFLHDRIFVPLEMNNTLAYEKGKNQVLNRAYGHTREKDGWRQTDQSPTSATLGDGGVYSSLEDLAKIYAKPLPNVATKETDHITEVGRAFIAASRAWRFASAMASASRKSFFWPFE